MVKKKSFFEKVEAEVISEAGDFVKEKVKKKLMRVSEISVSFLLAFILIIVGITQLLAMYFPALEGGWNYLVMGVLFLLIALILKL